MKSNQDIRKTSRRFNDKRRAALAIASYDDLMTKVKNIEDDVNNVLKESNIGKIIPSW